MSEKPLTNRQRKFCHEYIIDFNGTQAAIRAGYSKKGARVRGAQLLANSNVQKLLGRLQNRQNETSELTREFVIARLMKNADSENQTAANKALELLGKHLGIYTDRTEITGANGGPIETEFTVNFVGGKKNVQGQD